MDLAEDLIVEAVFGGYLCNITSYSQLRTAFKNAAQALCSNQNGVLAQQVEDAWYAVGVGTQPTQPTIDGSNIVCSTQSSYSIQNIPSGATVVWNKSDNITRVSYQWSNPCTFEANSLGNGWIEATLTSDCGEILLPRVNVVSDLPGISYPYDPSCNCQVSYGEVGEEYYFWALTDNPSTSTYDYYWEISLPEGSGWDEGYVDYGKQIYYSPPVEGVYTFKLKQNWTCGWSEFTTVYYEFYGGYRLLFTPNPTNRETILTIESKGSVKFDETA